MKEFRADGLKRRKKSIKSEMKIKSCIENNQACPLGKEKPVVII